VAENIGLVLGAVMGVLKISTPIIAPKILYRIDELDEIKGAWRALGTLAPERLSALWRIAAFLQFNMERPKPDVGPWFTLLRRGPSFRTLVHGAAFLAWQ